MTEELQALLVEAAESGWADDPSNRLAQAIERRIVAEVPSRLRMALGNDEAAQLARVLAWERCHRLAAQPPAGQVTWGYLANMVRWRLADVVRQDARRRQRHPLTDFLPERVQPALLEELGPHLDRIGAQLERAGLAVVEVRRRVVAASEGPSFSKHAITARVRDIGVPREQAEGLARLLHSGPIRRSALSQLASGRSADEVFRDPMVKLWINQAAGGVVSRNPRAATLGGPPGPLWSGRLGMGMARTA
ncbi:hypothetical protein OG555_19005 [Kribbella sp. NBC_01484]|uniref:hypothetical protein n=1 Tax=Kribbella sp. NBC_01484 TaxID=2903579 RepID=UPI002E34A0A9|nr:hypothetical protein [Kribbella sp. NBC_01484]